MEKKRCPNEWFCSYSKSSKSLNKNVICADKIFKTMLEIFLKYMDLEIFNF